MGGVSSASRHKSDPTGDGSNSAVSVGCEFGNGPRAWRVRSWSKPPLAGSHASTPPMPIEALPKWLGPVHAIPKLMGTPGNHGRRGFCMMVDARRLFWLQTDGDTVRPPCITDSKHLCRNSTKPLTLGRRARIPTVPTPQTRCSPARLTRWRSR